MTYTDIQTGLTVTTWGQRNDEQVWRASLNARTIEFEVSRNTDAVVVMAFAEKLMSGSIDGNGAEVLRMTPPRDNSGRFVKHIASKPQVSE